MQVQCSSINAEPLGAVADNTWAQTLLAGNTSPGTGVAVTILAGDTLQVDGAATVGTTLGVSGVVTMSDPLIQLRLTSSATDATPKTSRFCSNHYTTSEPPVGVAVTLSNLTANLIQIGGGSGLVNAATQVSILTAANNTTPTGTEAFRVDSSGNTSTLNGGDLDISGNFACNGVASAAPQAYTRAAAVVATRTLAANAGATAANNNAVIAQLLEDLAAIGLITLA